jgi:type VI secretion system Hcp family effector
MKRILGLALVAGLALTGLTACMGDDDGDGNAAERRRSAALVSTSTERSGRELVITGLTPSGQAIEVESFSWGLTNPGGVTPQTEALNITKHLDEVSPLLVKGAAEGKPFTSAVLTLSRSHDDRIETYATYELSGVQIVSVQQAQGGADFPTESVSLKYTSLKHSFTKYDNTGKAMSPVTVTVGSKS